LTYKKNRVNSPLNSDSPDDRRKTLHLKARDPIVEVVKTLNYGINQGKVHEEINVFYAGVVDTPISDVEPQ
jgi:hypothetical protein